MLYMKPIFWKPKMLVCTLGGEWGGGSENVYYLTTHENVDIFGWPLTTLSLLLYLCRPTFYPKMHCPFTVQISLMNICIMPICQNIICQ